MASEFCLSITKYFLFLFNLIFFVLGLSIVGLGIWIICSESSSLIPAPPYLSLSLFSYLLVISGSVTLLLGFFGSLGALKEVKCMLAVYFILLSVLLAAQTIGTVLLFTQRRAFESSLEGHITGIIKSFGNSTSSLQMSLERFQSQAQCCGWNGKSDWEEIPCSCYYINATVNATDESSNCFCTLKSKSNSTCEVYEQNCKEIIKDWFDGNLMTILGVLVALAVVECLQWVCLVTFCCLNRTNRCCRLRNSYGSHGQLSRCQSGCNVVKWSCVVHTNAICGTILSMCLYSQASTDYSMPFYY